MLLDLRFLLAILLDAGWTEPRLAPSGSDVARQRCREESTCPENGCPLSLGMREKDNRASGFDLNRNELSHWETNLWA